MLRCVEKKKSPFFNFKSFSCSSKSAEKHCVNIMHGTKGFI